LFAGLLTVYVTRDAARRTIAATRETADATIKATKETAAATISATLDAADREVAAAQAQTAEQSLLARRQTASESFAFFAMLSGAMDLLIADANTTRGTINVARRSGLPENWVSWCQNADGALTRVGFPDLRPAFVRYGGHLTSAFLGLDRDIEDVARIPRLQVVNRAPTPEDVEKMLTEIEFKAWALKRDAEQEWQRCSDLLAATDQDLGAGATMRPRGP
jgi:hypothetical protein